MPESHGSGVDAHRSFVVTAYTAGADGKFVAAMPSSCPSRKTGDAPCRLSVDHHRERKTGPCFALAVVCCGLHKQAFTLYPHGHVPDGRVAVAPVGADGAVVRDETAAEDKLAAGTASRAPLDWSSTVFGAAVDAAAGQAWPRRGPARRRSWRTQGRWLARGARLVGIAPRAAPDALRHRERMARHLGVPTLRLIDGARRWDEARGYRDRGAAIVAMMAEVERARSVADRLLGAGAIAGLWGRPSRWDPGGRVLRSLPFS